MIRRTLATVVFALGAAASLWFVASVVMMTIASFEPSPGGIGAISTGLGLELVVVVLSFFAALTARTIMRMAARRGFATDRMTQFHNRALTLQLIIVAAFLLYSMVANATMEPYQRFANRSFTIEVSVSLVWSLAMASLLMSWVWPVTLLIGGRRV